jgi:hypothetical protein
MRKVPQHFPIEAFVSFALEMVGQLVERNLSGISDMPVFPKSRLNAFELVLQLFERRPLCMTQYLRSPSRVQKCRGQLALDQGKTKSCR